MAEAHGAYTDVNGVKATLFKDSDPPIYLMPDGRFAMRYGGLWKVRGSIAPLLKMIGRYQAAIKLMRTNYLNEPSVYDPDKVQVIEAVSWDRGVIGLKDGKRNRSRYNSWYLHDPKIEQEINNLLLDIYKLEKAHAKDYAVMIKRKNALLKKLKIVTEGSFRGILSGLDEVRPRATGGKSAKA